MPGKRDITLLYTVVKRMDAGQAREAHTMAIESSQTSIPIPEVRRVVSWRRFLWLFMPYIEGDDLETVWPGLDDSWLYYIRQLWRVNLGPNRNTPGPVDGSEIPL